MPPKRKAAAAVEEPQAKTTRAKATPAPAPAQASKGKKAPSKKAPPKAEAPKKEAPKKGKKSKVTVDADEFAGALLEVCKVLMVVCETRVLEDEDEYTITVRAPCSHGQPTFIVPTCMSHA